MRSRNTFFEALRRKTAAVGAPAGLATGEDLSAAASADAPSGTSHATGSAPHTPDAAQEQLAGIKHYCCPYVVAGQVSSKVA